MKTFPILDELSARPVAFEIEAVFIGIRAIVDLLRNQESVSGLRRPNNSSEIKIQFTYRDAPCIVWEPFGDNSRYWIGPEDLDTHKVDLSAIEEMFMHYRPPIWRWILGNLVLLRFLTAAGAMKAKG